MCTSITITRRCGPLPRRTNIAGSNIVAHAVVTMETLSLFLDVMKNLKKNSSETMRSSETSKTCYATCLIVSPPGECNMGLTMAIRKAISVLFRSYLIPCAQFKVS